MTLTSLSGVCKQLETPPVTTERQIQCSALSRCAGCRHAKLWLPVQDAEVATLSWTWPAGDARLLAIQRNAKKINFRRMLLPFVSPVCPSLRAGATVTLAQAPRVGPLRAAFG